jgi:hypothetical protein
MRYVLSVLALLVVGLGFGLSPWGRPAAPPQAEGAQVRVAALVSVAGIELGPDRGVATPYVDFHSSGTEGLDFDSRLIGEGGDGRVGHGDLRAASARLLVDGTLKAGRMTAGQGDRAVVASIVANSAPEAHGGPAAVLGYEPGLGAASYGDIDSVAAYLSNTGRPPLFVVSGAALTVSADGARVVMPAGRPLGAPQLAQLFRGMQVLTNHAPAWTGWIEDWDPAGRWVRLIGGFTHLGGSTAPGQDPAAGLPPPGGQAIEVAFAPLTKVWIENGNCFLPGGAYAARSCAGYELGMFNETGRDHSWRGLADPAGYSWGFDAVNLGRNRAGSAHIARGNWDVGFHANVGGRFAFLDEGVGGGDGFVSMRTGGLAFAVRRSEAAAVWSVDAAGVMTAAAMVLPNLPACEVERRAGFVCRRGRVLEVNE